MSAGNSDDHPRVAIVTRVNERYIFIWDNITGINELRFPYKSIPGIEPGDLVSYRQREHPRGVQFQTEIGRYLGDVPITIIKTPNYPRIHFLVKTFVVFPPRDYRPYRRLLDNCRLCHAIAYSSDFHEVATFMELDYEPNVVYEAFICRIPITHDNLIQDVNTLFCITRNKGHDIIRPVKNDAVLRAVPWYDPPTDIDEDFVYDRPSTNGRDNGTMPSRDDGRTFDRDIGRTFGRNDDRMDDRDIGRNSGRDGDRTFDRGMNMAFDRDDARTSGRDNDRVFDRYNGGAGRDASTSSRVHESPLMSDDFRGRTHVSSHPSASRQEKIIDIDDNESYFTTRKPVQRDFRDDEEDAEVANNFTSRSYNLVGKHRNDDLDATSYQRPASKDVFVDEGCGVIVRLTSQYAIIWSSNHGLVVASGPSGFDRPLGTWVTYKCREDPNLRVEEDYLKKSAYDIVDITPRRISYKFNTTVKCQALVHLVSRSSDDPYFLTTKDDVFGIVLCSRDPFLTGQFRNNSEVEVFVIFMENYHRLSNWIAIGANHGDDDWHKLTGLPERVDEMAELAFAQVIRRSDEDELALYRNTQSEYAEHKFRPPEDWQSFRHLTDQTIADVLGVVICHESNNTVSVAFTIFGLARLQTFIELGTWLRMTIKSEPEFKEFPNCSALTPKHFRVLSGEKILPPMSTRVISPKNEDKVLLCGVVIRGLRCFENTYLGQVVDKGHISMDPDKPPSPKGFLVEFTAFKRKQGWYWEVVKNHGEAGEHIDHVPLQMSVFSNHEGKARDDAHTIMIDPKYVDPEFRNSAPISQPRSETDRFTHQRLPPSTSSAHVEDLPSESEKSKIRPSPMEIRREIEDLQKMTPAQCLLGNAETGAVSEELRRYKPSLNGPKTRGLCLVTKKDDTFALAYSKKFQIVLIKSDIFPTIGEFNDLCQAGSWINACFAKVQPDEDAVKSKRKLQFDYIAVPSVQRTKRTVPQTRLTGGFVQVYIGCEFNDKTVTRCEEEPSQLIAETALGQVLINETLYRKNDFHDSEQSIWITHIRKKHGCHWKFVLNDTLADFDYKFKVVQREIRKEKDEERARQERALLEKDLLLSDSFEEPQSVGPAEASLLSDKLTPQELLAGFGLKARTTSTSTGRTSKLPNNAPGQHRMPAISELAMEELRMLKRGNSTQSPAPASDSVQQQKAETESANKVKVNYRYAEAEDEVARINQVGSSASSQSPENEKNSTESTDKYSSIEILSTKNSIATCSTSTSNVQSSTEARDEESQGIGFGDSKESACWLNSNTSPTIDFSNMDAHYMQEICTLKSEESESVCDSSLLDRLDEMDKQFDQALDDEDEILQTVFSKDEKSTE